MKKITLLFTFLLMNYCLAAQNQPPIAVNDTLTLIEGNKLLGEVILNDFDPENDSIFTTALTDPEDGVLDYFCANGSFCYQPDPSFTGVDTFTYVLTDSLGNMDTATVFLNIEANNAITFGSALRIGCTSTVIPSCRTVFVNRIDPCTIPLRPSALLRGVTNLSGFQGESETKNLPPPSDSCDFYLLYDPPDFGSMYLSNIDSSNVITTAGAPIDSIFYYEPDFAFIGVTSDTFGVLKCGALDDGEIFCDSIQYSVTQRYLCIVIEFVY